MSSCSFQALTYAAIAAALTLPTALAQAPGPSGPTPGPIDWSKAELVVVRLAEYQFVPDHIVLRRGVPYRLRLDNQGTEIHDFTAPDFFQAVSLADPGVLGSNPGNIVVKPHQQTQLKLVPQRSGSYQLRCADHDWAGMTGAIIVE